MTTRALVFDLGKVIIDFSVDSACQQIAAVSATTPDFVRSFLFDDGLENRFECGEFDIAELCRLFEKKLERSLSREDLAHACSNIFHPIPDSLSLLKELRGNVKMPMILLSNTNHVHWDFICRNFGVQDYFDAHVLSFRERVMKPHPKIYAAAVEAAGCAPHECFFTDDILENVIGARNAGIDAVQFTSPSQLRIELMQRRIQLT